MPSKEGDDVFTKKARGHQTVYAIFLQRIIEALRRIADGEAWHVDPSDFVRAPFHADLFNGIKKQHRDELEEFADKLAESWK